MAKRDLHPAITLGAMGHTPVFLAAPDSFKGTFAAADVAVAIARGVEAAGGTADRCPLADGGEGTLAVLVDALDGELVSAPAHDPLGRALEAEFGLIHRDATAIVETAAASGLALVDPAERDPERASTRGTGELLAAAAASGARRILLAVGGTASTDGGSGAIEAIEAAGGLGEARIEALCDVRTPFEHAADVFAPQKGAGPDAVRRLRARLAVQASTLPRDPRGVAMAGAGGGIAGGLWARFDARLRLGVAFVLDAVGFDERAARADVVITGEGRIDAQSFEGKVVGDVVSRCREIAKPVHAIVGVDELGEATARHPGLASVSVATTLAEIEAAARALAI